MSNETNNIIPTNPCQTVGGNKSVVIEYDRGPTFKYRLVGYVIDGDPIMNSSIKTRVWDLQGKAQGFAHTSKWNIMNVPKEVYVPLTFDDIRRAEKGIIFRDEYGSVYYPAKVNEEGAYLFSTVLGHHQLCKWEDLMRCKFEYRNRMATWAPCHKIQQASSVTEPS